MALALSITDARGVTTAYHRMTKMLWNPDFSSVTVWYHSYVSEAAYQAGASPAEDTSQPQQFQVSGAEYAAMQAQMGSSSTTISASVVAQCDAALKALTPDGSGVGFYGADWSQAVTA